MPAGGLLAHSLAVMTDAAHVLSDLAGFLISLFALFLARRPPSNTMSFGWHRAEILGAVFSVLLIWAVTGVLVYEAVLRVINPPAVDGKIMFITAVSGIAVNILCAMRPTRAAPGLARRRAGLTRTAAWAAFCTRAAAMATRTACARRPPPRCVHSTARHCGRLRSIRSPGTGRALMRRAGPLQRCRADQCPGR